MSVVIIILALSLSPGTALNIRGVEDTNGRILNVNSRPGGDQILLEQSQWGSLIHGPFMREILFGIHPESPRNREIWIKSGLLRPQNHQLRNIPLPVITNQGRPIIPNEVQKVKRPMRRKLSPLKRLPKLGDLNEDSVKRNITEVNTKPKLPPAQPAPIQLPKGLRIPTSIPVAAISENSKSPRCFIQTTVPVVYYFLPVAQMPFVPKINENLGPKTTPSLFQTGQYAPIQNRLPYPPRVVYLNPVPLDLLAMEGGKDEQKLSFQQAITRPTAPATQPIIFSVPQPSVPIPTPAINQKENTRISNPSKVEFRGENLPLEIFSKHQEKDVNNFNSQNQNTPIKDVIEQNIAVVINKHPKQDEQEEIELKKEGGESIQETTTQAFEQEVV